MNQENATRRPLGRWLWLTLLAFGVLAFALSGLLGSNDQQEAALQHIASHTSGDNKFETKPPDIATTATRKHRDNMSSGGQTRSQQSVLTAAAATPGATEFAEPTSSDGIAESVSGRGRFDAGGSASQGATADDQPDPRDRHSIGSTDEETEAPNERLARDAIIAGRVLDTTGLPLAGIEAVAIARQFFGADESTLVEQTDRQHHAVSGDDGRYTFKAIPAGEYNVQTVPTKRYPTSSRTVRTGLTSVDFMLTARQPLTLSGRVTDRDGQPLPWVLISPFILKTGGQYTDSDGQYSIDLGLSESNTGFGVRARRDGYREQTILVNEQEASAGRISVDFVLEPIAALAHVSGTITSEDGAPVADVNVRLRATGLQQDYLTATNADGYFNWPLVEAGAGYALSVRAGAGFVEFSQADVTIPADGARFDITLPFETASTVYGRLLDANGAAIPNFPLRVRRETAPHHTLQFASDAGGNFVAAPVPAGRLIFETRSDPQYVVRGLEILPGGDAHVALTLDWGALELNGRIVDPDGAPVPANDVRLTWVHHDAGLTSWSSRRTAADFGGYFRFSELGPGSHTVTLNVPGYKSVEIVHDSAVQGYELTVTLEHETAALSMNN